MKGKTADKGLMSDEPEANDGYAPTRRRLLLAGGVAASAVVTLRPALAQTAGSVLNCQIPVPDPARSGQYIAPDGSLVAPNTPGAFAPAPRPLTGQEVKAAFNGQTPRGLDPQATQAYTNYIRRLQQGQSGFTCYASLQMPRG